MTKWDNLLICLIESVHCSIILSSFLIQPFIPVDAIDSINVFCIAR